LDRYRVEREWTRYSGTPQRELFLQLRERFLGRHAGSSTRALDLGSGPGRFSQILAATGARVVALDLSPVALRYLVERWPSGANAPPLPDIVRGDGVRPPFRANIFGLVAVLGNSLGFAGPAADRLLASAQSLVAPGGRLVLEIAPGPGERSRYLHRLPVSSVARLLRAPTGAVAPRILREGFAPEPVRKRQPGEFRRLTVEELKGWFEGREWFWRETMAVAPALGPDAERIAVVRKDEKAWSHLLALEEEIGRPPDRARAAAAVLIAVERRASEDTIN
jgi:SAM-dependent methyltransferase